MKDSYKRRPQDFKRKIISKIETNKKDLLEEEYKWLKLIKTNELKIKYYNLHNHKFNHWSSNEKEAKNSIEKMANSLRIRNSAMSQEERNEKFGTRRGSVSHLKGKTFEEFYGKEKSDELKEIMRQNSLGKRKSEETKNKLRGKPSPMLGKTHTEEARLKISLTHKGTIKGPPSEETKSKIGIKNKKRMTDKWQDDEYREKMRNAHIGHKATEETKLKMRQIRQSMKEEQRKIKEPQRLEILHLFNSGKNRKEIMNEYNISRTTLYRIAGVPV
tara:strand:- start:8993 stop:9811 length:819 start_codon:yes stop_codon:yes gene_type:complete